MKLPQLTVSHVSAQEDWNTLFFSAPDADTLLVRAVPLVTVVLEWMDGLHTVAIRNVPVPVQELANLITLAALLGYNQGEAYG